MVWHRGDNMVNPAASSLVKGPGRSGWFGWYEGPRMQELVQAWMDAPDAGRQRSLADEINKLAQDDLATAPLGQFFIRTAYRKSITGLVKGSMPYPWGARRGPDTRSPGGVAGAVRSLDEVFARLADSAFRRRFRLAARERDHMRVRG